MNLDLNSNGSEKEKISNNDDCSSNLVNLIEENSVDIISDMKSSSIEDIAQEKKLNLLNLNISNQINFEKNLHEKIIEKNIETNKLNNENLSESSIINSSIDLGTRTKNYSLFSKGLLNKKDDILYIETENQFYESNNNTIKLSNIENNEHFCYKIDNYSKILKELKVKNSNISDSYSSNIIKRHFIEKDSKK
jgi:hypothetical protein